MNVVNTSWVGLFLFCINIAILRWFWVQNIKRKISVCVKQFGEQERIHEGVIGRERKNTNEQYNETKLILILGTSRSSKWSFSQNQSELNQTKHYNARKTLWHKNCQAFRITCTNTHPGSLTIWWGNQTLLSFKCRWTMAFQERKPMNTILLPPL